jgi:hypothetical protein
VLRVFQVVVIALSMMLVGCSSSPTPTEPLVTVTGIVTQIDDRVPVDGGVTITLKLDDGGTELLFFGSLFTSPPPDEEMLALYQRILEAEVGSHVKASGLRVEAGIELRDLTVLEE